MNVQVLDLVRCVALIIYLAAVFSGKVDADLRDVLNTVLDVLFYVTVVIKALRQRHKQSRPQ